jgi:hypothetical protein
MDKKINLLVSKKDIQETHLNCKSVHYAGCFKGSKLCSKGYNQERTFVGGKIIGCSYHAEVHAINNLLKVA